jgi:thioredoxin-related protein
MQTRKTYTLHVISSQGCGYCHLIMQYLAEIGACGLTDVDIVFHEFLLRDFPHKQKSDIDFSKYPDCAEVRLAEACSDGLTNVYPRTIIYDNERGKIIDKITGYSPQLLGAALQDIIYQ